MSNHTTKKTCESSYFDYLECFTPKYGQIQESIYREWLKRIYFYIEEFQLSDKNASQLLKQKIFSYFFSYSPIMRSPFELPDIQKATELLKECYYDQQKKILFYADRDADGISSLAILYLFFRDQLKYPEENLIALVPHEEDKYGITEEVASRIFKYTPDLVITLDCGSSNHVEIKSLYQKYKETKNVVKKLKTIVIDHHFIPKSEEEYPKVDAFVNPKRLTLSDPNRELCTSGISYKLIWSLTYSFTREYNRSYQVSCPKNDSDSKQSHIYFKNLIKNNNKNRLENTTASVDTVMDFSACWGKMVSSNSLFNRMNSFLHSCSNLITVEDQIRFIFQANLRNINEKIHPYVIFAAIGSIADMVPLIDDNRIMVKEGLYIINKNLKNTAPAQPSLRGVLALIRALFSQQNQIQEENLAFTVCPAINAAGRLGKAKVALNSLLENDRLGAVKAASELKQLNQTRKEISKEAMNLIIPSLKESSESKKIVIAYDPEIHRGISGLLANRLCEHFGKPSLVLVDDGDSLRGSIRSSQNQNVFSFLSKLEHFFIQFGGHKQAAGFSMKKDQREKFTCEAEEIAELFFAANSQEKQTNEETDAENEDEYFEAIPICDHQITSSLWEECKVFSPFGKKNPKPVLAVKLTQPVVCQSLGKTGEHAKIKFSALKND